MSSDKILKKFFYEDKNERKEHIHRIACHRRSSSTEFKYAANDIPKSAYEELARCFLPEITAYFESEEGKREYGIYLSKRNLH